MVPGIHRAESSAVQFRIIRAPYFVKKQPSDVSSAGGGWIVEAPRSFKVGGDPGAAGSCSQTES